MTPALINHILLNWTGHPNLDVIETNELEHWVDQHPYSPSLQFLLAKKYDMEGSPLLLSQLQKTTSFFPSTLQLHHWLHSAEQDSISAPIEEKLSSLISDQLAQFKEPVVLDTVAYEMELTPLQKDYFAAQGIEIDLSKLPQDKFTQQLRSFTAWLKVLKDKEGTPVVSEIGEAQEKAINAIAEKANIMEEVVTEAMAEIWEKQGQPRKAIALYSKLSFIFPEKSVYFASRIEQLKQRK
ncbi:MAG: hypothetical protein WCP61_04780 [Chitinophagia bacterium]|jgi:hypothetical protein